MALREEGNMVKILYVCGGIFDLGGISTFIINYYRNFTFENISIDFAVHGYETGIYDEEIEKKGSHIYHLPIRSKHPFKHKKCFEKILKNNDYDIIHSHLDSGNYPILKIAKKNGIKIRIAHSHNTDFLCTNKFKIFLNKIYKSKITSVSTHNLACSNDAGKWLFGKEKFYVFKNAIDTSLFAFNQSFREAKRKELGFSQNDLVIGHVGRFDYQKNQAFLIQLLFELNRTNKNFKLVLIGDGHLRQTIISEIEKYRIDRSVVLLGKKATVFEYYNAFDFFALPSLFEGLGIVAIEAQTNGLCTVMSDRVPAEACLSPNAIRFPLDIQVWKDFLVKTDKCRNPFSIEKIKESGYDIKKEASKLEEFYLKIVMAG